MNEYPTLVQIETTLRCQACCEFCPHKDMKRPQEDMDSDLFIKILEQCKDFGLKHICPFLNGELFCDSLWFERLKLINAILPNTGIDIFTNIGMLDAGKIQKLKGIKNINNFAMSIHSYDTITANERTKLKWETVYTNATELIAENLKNRFIDNLQVLSVDFGASENKKFLTKWQQIKGIDNVFVGTKQNWKGDIPIDSPDLHSDIICPRTYHICIAVDGQVPLCCMDAHIDFPMGDVRNNSILEIFNGDYKKYRQKRKKDLMPCNQCSMS